MKTSTLFFLLFLIVFFYLGFNSVQASDSISNYVVPSNLPLNENLTIYGKYNNSTGQISDVLCAFYIFDLQNLDTNRAVIRFNDKYTFSDGSFYSEYKITEPLFRRGIDYNAITKCGNSEIGKTFKIIQKEDIGFGILPQSLINDFKFWVDPQNSFTIVVLFGFFLVLIVILSPIILAIWH